MRFTCCFVCEFPTQVQNNAILTTQQLAAADLLNIKNSLKYERMSLVYTLQSLVKEKNLACRS